MNVELHKKAASDFEKDLYKLMYSSVFCKTIENIRKRVDVKLIRSHEKNRLRNLIASPTFAGSNIFDNDPLAIQVHKSKLVLNKPVYVLMSVLDLSKHLIYNFFYNNIKTLCVERCDLLADSLLMEILTEDVY